MVGRVSCFERIGVCVCGGVVVTGRLAGGVAACWATNTLSPHCVLTSPASIPCLDQDAGRQAEPRTTRPGCGSGVQAPHWELSVQSLEPGLPRPELQPGPSGRGMPGVWRGDRLEKQEASQHGAAVRQPTRCFRQARPWGGSRGREVGTGLPCFLSRTGQRL